MKPLRKRWLVVFSVIAVSLFLAEAPASARTRSKTWTGTIQLPHPGGEGFFDVTEGWFQGNGCSWGPGSSFDGFDAVIFKITPFQGARATLSWSTDSPFVSAGPGVIVVSGYFIDSHCNQL